MALIRADCVKESSTSTGTGTFALAGAATGYRTFSSVCAIGDTFYYAISNQSNGEWESGLGTYSAANTLTRTTVHASSNSGNAVTFSAGTKEVFLTLTARHLDRIQDNGQSTAIGSKTSVVAVNDSATLPDLDLQFADLKTLTAKYGPTPSYSRASTGTYFNASGVLTSAAINEPRFDHVYSGGQWVSRGLLIEEQRTNLATYSNSLNWTPYEVTISTNQAISPDGNTNATKLVENTNTSRKSVYFFFTWSGHSLSVYAKAAGRNYLWMSNSTTASGEAIFNLADGTVYINNIGAKIQDVGNGWYRCSIYASSGNAVGIGPSTTSTSYTGDGTSGVYVWGAQLESGSFSTSYIPNLTTGSTTRSADVCQITGSAFTNLWNTTEGSFSTEYDRLFTPSGNPFWVWQIDDTTDSERLGLVYEPSASPVGEQMFVIDGNSVQARVGTTGLVSGTIGKFASCYKANDFAGTLNGASVNTDTSGTLPTVTQWKIGYSGSSYLNGHISRLRYFRSRLDNTQLVNLSGGINTLAFKPVTGSGSVTVANEFNGITVGFDNLLRPATYADSAAPTNSVYYSSTAGKLVYKDSGGTVNNLY